MADAVYEAIVSAAEIIVSNERERTRMMNESLKADQAAVQAKETERLMLNANMDRMEAEKQAKDELVADFLDAIEQGNLDDNAMKEALLAFGDVDEIGDGGGLGGYEETDDHVDDGSTSNDSDRVDDDLVEGSSDDSDDDNVYE